MSKRVLLAVLVLCTILLASCSRANEYGLAYTSDGTGKVEYIFYTDERVVYVIDGIMMAEIDGNSKMLEMALKDGDISVDDIINSAESDVESKAIESTDYPDGSREYHYDGFDMIRLNTYDGSRDLYFVPSSMSYYDVIN